MSTLIQLRRGTAAAWTAANPVLHAGEAAVELDTGPRAKVGDGVTAWTSLPYLDAYVFTGGDQGALAMRDTGSVNGYSWLPSKAGVLVSDGDAEIPVFRPLVEADIPTLSYSKLTLTGAIEDADIVSMAWSKLTGTPTTLAGYGITSPLPAAQGGSGQDTSGWSGVPTLNGGTWTQNNVLTGGRLLFAAAGNTISGDADLTFAVDTLTATKIAAPTSVATPSLITAAGDLTLTPAAGSSLRVALATTGDFAVNTDQLYVDTSTGKVGIGTAGPDTTLTVVKTSGYTVTTLRDAASGPELHFERSEGTVNAPTAVTADDTLAGAITGTVYDGSTYQTGSYIAHTTDGTQSAGSHPGKFQVFTTPTGSDTPLHRLRVGQNGFMGIGQAFLTTTPDSLLHVHAATAGSVAAIGGTTVTIESNTTNYISMLAPDANLSGIVFGSPSDVFGALMRWKYSTATMEIGTTTAGGVIDFLTANGTQVARIDASGWLGIGTTTPGSLLDLLGAAPGITNATKGLLNAYTNDSQAADKGGSLTLGGYITGTSTARNFAGIVGCKENGTSANEQGYLALLTNNGGTLTERMRIASTGRVGVGTTSPLVDLHVVGNTPTVVVIEAQATNASSFAELFANADTAKTVMVAHGSSFAGTVAGLSRANMSWIEAQSASAFLLSTVNSGTAPIVFSPGRTEVMRLTSTGRLGIGTTTPGALLDLLGAAPGISNSTKGLLNVYTNDSQAADKGGSLTLGGYITGTSTARNFASIAGLKENGTSANEAGYLAFRTNNGGTLAEVARLDSSGKLGVGVTSPVSPLDLYASGGAAVTVRGYLSGARETLAKLVTINEAVALSGASVSTVNQVPAGAFRIGVTISITTAMTGATGYKAGDGLDDDLFGDITGTAAGTHSANANATANPTGYLSAATGVTLTAKTSNFTGGVAQVTQVYLTTTAA